MTNKISIGFTGDLSFSGYFRDHHEDEQLIDPSIFEFLDKNAANVINFESPITPCRMTKKKRLAHRSDPKVLDYIQNRFKNPILSLANNHMMDFGRIGMMDTLEILQEKAVPYIGAGTTVSEVGKYQIIGDEIKVGVFAVQYKDYMVAGTRYAGPVHDKRKKYIQSVISELKKQVDYVVLIYHGGEEFLHAPMPYFRKHLKNYLNMGCDLVVAHHPHVVQGYEYFGKKMIFYSLGNFMFDTDYQRVQKDTDRGVLLNIAFTKEGFDFESLPIRIDRENCRVLAAEKDPYFQDIKKGYGKLWSMEAARMDEILENKAELREREFEQSKTEKQESKEKLNAILAKYRSEEDMDVETEDEYGSEVTGENDAVEDVTGDAGVSSAKIKRKKRKKSICRRILSHVKKIIRMLRNPKTYEKIVRTWGSWKAKLFYGY